MTDPEIYAWKKVIVIELKQLFRQFRDYKLLQNKALEKDDFRNWLWKSLDETSFEHLFRHRFEFEHFLIAVEDGEGYLELILSRNSTVKCSEFADSWIAHRLGYKSVEKVRQNISKLRNFLPPQHL